MRSNVEFVGSNTQKDYGVIGHISERENGNWMKIIALLRDWHPV